MAARRLIIVMLVLLGISTAIAIMVPDPTEQTDSTGTTGATSPGDGTAANPGATANTDATTNTDADGSTGTGGNSGVSKPGRDNSAKGTIEAAVAVNRGGKPDSVCARPGLRLVLTVNTGGPLDVSVPDFGRTASVTAYAPAVFDLLMPEQPGRFEVEALSTGRELAMIASNLDCGRQQ